MTASSPAPSRSPSTDLAISVEAASKRYLKLADTPTLVGRALQLRNRTRRGELWALRDVSFTAERGECLGFIGRNGSGKSTLLRMLAGVTAPSRGAVEVRGRVAPLIAVGVGFHPELTGRENVVVSSAILGRDPAATAEAFDEIVAFADIGDFLDTPVKFYSSGMFVRLGFAVAISIAPEVLLVDEVLAVGDIGFQQRCFARIDELRAAGTTIVLVSHNLNAVRRLCDRTGVLHDGTLRHLGDTGEAIALFQHLLATDGGARAASALQVRSARLVDDAGADAGTVAAGQRFSLDLDLACTEAVDDPVLTVQVVNDQGVQLAAISYPHLSREEIYHGVETFYRRFYFRPSKIWEIVREMMGSWSMTRRRLREGVEFFRFLHSHEA